MRGQGTRLSDIDLAVVFDALVAARRESFDFQGAVETFVHDADTLAWLTNDDSGLLLHPGGCE